jgi:hypothetical protein
MCINRFAMYLEPILGDALMYSASFARYGDAAGVFLGDDDFNTINPKAKQAKVS